MLHSAFALLLLTLTLLDSSQNVFGRVLSRRSPSLPSFVNDYAPLIWLSSTEKYFPSEISGHLSHVKARVDYNEIIGAPDPLKLDNLDQLNNNGGSNVFLTSVDDVTQDPSWLTGAKPDGDGRTGGAPSCAVIINDHGKGMVDVFYLYFYSYNLGSKAFGKNRGNHVGDWEHVMIRFQDEKPAALWYSQHNYGQAFTYDAVEKQGVRPLAYSAVGTHAAYATAGKHDHSLLVDNCDKGTLWDPSLNAYYISFDRETQSFSAYDDVVPTQWLGFTGHWGDQRYPDSDRRQSEIFGIGATARFTDGPMGPKDKQLDRTQVCPEKDGLVCVVRSVLEP